MKYVYAISSHVTISYEFVISADSSFLSPKTVEVILLFNYSYIIIMKYSRKCFCVASFFCVCFPFEAIRVSETTILR